MLGQYPARADICQGVCRSSLRWAVVRCSSRLTFSTGRIVSATIMSEKRERWSYGVEAATAASPPDVRQGYALPSAFEKDWGLGRGRSPIA